MIFGLFQRGPLLDEVRSEWLFDAFEWSLHHFDAPLFRDHARLVAPTNDFFPGRAESVQALAELMLDRVKAYAGIAHWPTELVDGRSCPTPEAVRVAVEGALRRFDGGGEPGDEPLLLTYDPSQVNNPEGLIAAFSHAIAHYLAAAVGAPPPGGGDYWMQATEVLAIYLGFGLMVANSADNFRGGCGSCYNAAAQRTAFLAQDEVLFALAIFAALKGVPEREVTAHLKGSLRGLYRRAARQVAENEAALAQLRAIQ